MTFDQWIDTVNAQVHARLGNQVQTEELSWDSAIWVGPKGTVVVSLSDDETTAAIGFDRASELSLAFKRPDASPEIVAGRIAEHLAQA